MDMRMNVRGRGTSKRVRWVKLRALGVKLSGETEFRARSFESEGGKSNLVSTGYASGYGDGNEWNNGASARIEQGLSNYEWR